MSALEAMQFVRGAYRFKQHRVKTFRIMMRRYALLWRHASKLRQWETAELALCSAVECRDLAKLAGGAL